MLKMAAIARRRLARELVRLLSEQPERKQQLITQTAAYLLQTKQAHQLHLLINDIADELLASQHHLSADVRTAFGLSDATRQEIVAMLQKATGAQTVELHETTEPELLGGVIVRTPKAELDASVKRQITQLAGGIQ
jgi:F0F1-type ATP synthase delta subunit